MNGVRTGYTWAYRLGIRPWERYGTAASASIASLLDREELDRSRPLGRALDLGCGRGQKTHDLARRGWEAVGVDNVPAAIAAASRRQDSGARFVVADVTELESCDLAPFDFFLDAGCFQHLDAPQRAAAGRGVTALAAPGATLLMLEFQVTRMRSVVGGVSRQEIESALPAWETVSVEPAPTTGLGWPMTRTTPQWYRLRRTD